MRIFDPFSAFFFVLSAFATPGDYVVGHAHVDFAR